MNQTDVLILGGGLTGIAAADEIIQHSTLRVTLLQCGGGASPYIHAFCMPLGASDSEELFLEDTMASGYQQSDPVLAETLCRNALPLLDYFKGLELDLDRDDAGNYRLLHSLGSSVPRIAGIHNNTGPTMLQHLRRRLNQSGRYTELKNHRAVELIRQNGRVIGAKCFVESEQRFYTVFARTVILATGGFGRLFPESTNSADIGGDGCAMALEAGASLADMEFVQFEPSAAVWPPQVAGKGIVTTMFYDGAVLRGKNGNRFMLENSPAGECVPKDVLSKCIYREMSQNGTSPHGGVWFDATGVPEEKWQGAYLPYLNRYLACGIDLRREPVEIAPAAHTTCGGVIIDSSCRTGVPGLIACGEVTGGLHGANRLGGNAGLETMVFGRIAGQTAVEEVLSASTLPDTSESIANHSADVDISALRDRLQQLIRSHLNVTRSGEGLAHGIDALSQLFEDLGPHENCYEKHRLYNDLWTVYAAFISAAERTSSVGCHNRSDAVTEPDLYRVEMKKADGHLIVCRVSV